MDERQAQIREGAGLDEARLNVEFIEFLKKWSTPILVVIAVIALGYFLLQKQRERRVVRLETAFAALDEARIAGSPAGLLGVAEDHRGQGAVAEVAELAAADVYLASYRAGVKPEGMTRINTTTGLPEDEADLLNEADRAAMLDRAAELYQKVASATSGKPDMVVHALGATYGLAAVAESKGDMEAARRAYAQIESMAKAADLQDQVLLVNQRLETLGTLANLPRLYMKSEIPVPMQGQFPAGFNPAGLPIDAATATSPINPELLKPQPVPVVEPEEQGPAAPDAPTVPPAPAAEPAPSTDKPAEPAPAAEPKKDPS